MTNFFISLLILSFSAFFIGSGIRFGLSATRSLDDYFIQRSGSSFGGFGWYFRIPSTVGALPEYFFYLVIGEKNYFRANWWPLKISSFLSIMLFLAILNKRDGVYAYYSLDYVREHGISALFISDNFVWFLNMISLFYLSLFTLIVIESIRMHGIYSPIRIISYTLLSFLMTDLTILAISLLVFFAFIYVAFKILKFFFTSRRYRYRNSVSGEEVKDGFFRKGFAEFKVRLYAWESEYKSDKRETISNSRELKKKRRRPDIKRIYGEDIPKLKPD